MRRAKTVAVQCRGCGTFGTWPFEDVPIPLADLRFDLQVSNYSDGYLLTAHVGRGDNSKHVRIEVDGRASRDPQILMRALAEVVDQLAQFIKPVASGGPTTT